jgi:CBS domain containing-hemolysin-like protein
MLKNILSLRGQRIEDVMVPRADIVAIQQDIPLGDLIRIFEGAGHSRLVVYNDTLDDPAGMVHIRDLIAFMTKRAEVDPELNARRKRPLPSALDLKAIDLAMQLSATKIIRPILFVPPSMPAIDLLAKMQTTRIHLALVIDEYGGTDGLVSMEDIVEQIVGDIEDEHDVATLATVVRQADSSFIVDARASLEEVAVAIGPEFDIGDAAEEVDTIGGYLVAQVGRLPVRGEIVPGPGRFEFEVLDADPRRVKKLKIHRSRQLRVAAEAAPARAARAATAPAADPASAASSPAKTAQQP